MAKHRRLVLALLVVLASAGALSAPPVRVAVESLPQRLSDRDFWRLVVDFSEPNGYFRSDNLLSNEVWYQHVVPELIQRTSPGGVYLGVGPEQNFTYIAAVKPRLAFIPDIRRGNLHLQLVYKAVFELSANRAEFVGRLFTRSAGSGVGPSSTAAELFAEYLKTDVHDDEAFKNNLKAIDDVLVRKHRLPLPPEDLAGIEYVYQNFYKFGPGITYNSSAGGFGGFGNFVSYADLMQATDANDVNRSFLSNEENFRIVKDLEERNLVVPLVGNLAGPKAIRSVGGYVKDHEATVAAFYLSNVEQFLYGDGSWTNFCRNVAALPLDAKSTFIRSERTGGFGRGLMSVLASMQADIRRCVEQ